MWMAPQPATVALTPLPCPGTQVLKLLGSVEGLRIVELGAGIGRCAHRRHRCRPLAFLRAAAAAACVSWASPAPPSTTLPGLQPGCSLAPRECFSGPHRRRRLLSLPSPSSLEQVHGPAGGRGQERGGAGLHGEPDGAEPGGQRQIRQHRLQVRFDAGAWGAQGGAREERSVASSTCWVGRARRRRARQQQGCQGRAAAGAAGQGSSLPQQGTQEAMLHSQPRVTQPASCHLTRRRRRLVPPAAGSGTPPSSRCPTTAATWLSGASVGRVGPGACRVGRAGRRRPPSSAPALLCATLQLLAPLTLAPPSVLPPCRSNWLLMYLGDAEVEQLARNMLNWVRK